MLFAGLVFGSLILLWSANFLMAWLGSGLVWDITADKRYSLSRETLDFLAKNEMNVSIRLYVSSDLAAKNPEFGAYALYIKKLLDEYRQNSRGLLDLTITEVQPFTNTQVAAEKAGVTELTLPSGETHLYLGASLTNPWGDSLTINGFYPKRQKDVEDDITRALSVLTSGVKKTIGVMSPYFNISMTANPLDNTTDWPFISQLRAAGFKIVPINEGMPYIPRSVDAVLVYYPLKLDRLGLYALDQYLMHGGNIIMMADSFSEERFRGKDTFVTYQSGVGSLLEKMGISYAEDILIGDNANSRPLVLDGQKIKYPFLLDVGETQITKNPITKGISKLWLDYAGLLEYTPQKDLAATVLFTTGENSGAMSSEKVTEESYQSILKNYYVTEGKYPLAILLEGKFSSIFEEPLTGSQKLLDAMPVFLTTGIENGKFLFVADADMALEILWSDAKISGIYEAEFISDNMRFIRNAADYMTDSSYMSVPPKKQNNPSENLAAAFYKKALDTFAASQTDNAKEYAEVQQKILLKQEQMSMTEIPSLKLAKEIEELQRKEERLREQSEFWIYLTKQEYEKSLSLFSQIVLIGFPLGFIMILAGVYKLYQIRLLRRIKGIRND